MEQKEIQTIKCDKWIDTTEELLRKASSQEFMDDAFSKSKYRFIQLSSTKIEIKKSNSDVSLKFNFEEDLSENEIETILRVILDYNQ